MVRASLTVQGSSAVIQYVYHNDDLLLELDGAGSRIREYSYLPGIDRPHSMRQWANGEAGKMYYYQLQAPGHVNGLVDAARNLVNEYRYTPFGTPANGFPVEGTPNPLQYMARELDATTGLYYVRNRWYDPEMRRFVSEDPIGLVGGINKYEYVVGNPITYTDPSGLGCQWSVRVPVYSDYIMQNGISGWQQVASGTYSWCMMALFRMQSQNPAGVDWGIRGGVHPGGGGGGTVVVPRDVPEGPTCGQMWAGAGLSVLLDAATLIPAVAAYRGYVSAGNMGLQMTRGTLTLSHNAQVAAARSAFRREAAVGAGGVLGNVLQAALEGESWDYAIPVWGSGRRIVDAAACTRSAP